MQTPYPRSRYWPVCTRGVAIIALTLLLCACAAQTPVREGDEDGGQATSQPTVYGKLDMSVDNVSIR